MKLRGDAEFRNVFQTGIRTGGNLLSAHVLAAQRETRAGFITGRAVGGAVARNRARRLMREAWKVLNPSLPPGTHVVFVARSPIRAARAADVVAEMRALLRASAVVKP